MDNAFIVSCPLCGVLGKAGEPCEFCGATIVMRNDVTTYEERIISKRTISSMAFAQKVSVFKTVGEFIYNCSVVRMGSLCGLINLNGDFIFPLEYGNIVVFPEGYAYLRKNSEEIIFDLTKWKPLDLELSGRGAPDCLYRSVLDGNYYITLNWDWYEDDGHHQINIVCFFDLNDQVVLWSRYTKKCNTGFISHHDDTYVDIRTRKKYSLPFNKYDEHLISPDTDSQGNVVVALDWWRKDYYCVVNTEVEDIQAEINRACEELILKYKASTQPEKKRVGCVIAFLPFLTLGTGAFIGVLELIKLVIC